MCSMAFCNERKEMGCLINFSYEVFYEKYQFKGQHWNTV